jgi:hypothetical protein
MNKIIFNNSTGDLICYVSSLQDLDTVLSNFVNCNYIEVENLPTDDQYIFTHRVNLTTLEIETKT